MCIDSTNSRGFNDPELRTASQRTFAKPTNFGLPYGRAASAERSTEYVGLSTPVTAASPYPGKLVSAAPTTERTTAAVAAGYTSPISIGGVPQFSFARHTATGAVYVRAHGVWNFVRDEGVYENGRLLDIGFREAETWREFAKNG